MKNFVRVLLCFSLGVFSVTPNSAKGQLAVTPPEEKAIEYKADAKTLLHVAKQATAKIIKSARTDKDLDPKKAKNKPFWQSLQAVTKSLKTADAGLAAKKDDFFKGIADAREAEAQMKVGWQLTDSKNNIVIENGKQLGQVLALLRMNFSKEAERKKKSDELTNREQTQFRKIKAQQKGLIAQIRKLEGEVKKERALANGLAKLKKQAERIVKWPATLDGYIATLDLLDIQAGLIRGYFYYVDPDGRKDYLVLIGYTKKHETWYSEWAPSVTYDWAGVNQTVEIDEGENIDLTDDVSRQEIASESAYAEKESFEMTQAEQDEVAMDEDAGELIASVDDESVEPTSENEDEENTDEASDDDGGD